MSFHDGPPAPRTAVVLGGNSDIARATLSRLAEDGLERVVLAVRDPGLTRQRLAAHPLGIGDVVIEEWDALDDTAHAGLLDRAGHTLGQIDLVICAVGSLGHSAGIASTPAEAAALFASNFTGPATALTEVAHRLIAQGHGTIVVLSSVAGLRPRRSNYLYGSAKAGLDSFTQGLADATADSGIRVHLIRPGFVTSSMTAGLKPAPFATTPDVVAEAIAAVVGRSCNQVVHVPKVLGPMFGVLRAAPRPIWRRIAGNR